MTNNQKKLGQKIKNIFVNSGNANACTGKQGDEDNLKIAELVSSKLDGETITASTGKIGVPLKMNLILDTIKNISFDCEKKLSDDIAIQAFSESILTTDLRIKISQDSNQHLLGFTKGSGMIHPNMATMLGFIISDIRIKDLDEKTTQNFFQETLKEVTEKTFNSISVDGDTSTNDMVIFTSNAQGKEISKEEFKSSLEQVSLDLAQQIINDGEGTSKIIECKVLGEETESKLKKIAKGIINSNLVKTAIFGNDPNWGRIIAAAGQAASENNIDFKPEKVSLTLLGQELYSNGKPVNQNKRSEYGSLMKKNKVIKLELIIADKVSQCNEATVWGSDLSYDYIKINAEYFT